MKTASLHRASTSKIAAATPTSSKFLGEGIVKTIDTRSQPKAREGGHNKNSGPLREGRLKNAEATTPKGGTT